MLQTADCSTTLTMFVRLRTFVLLYSCLRRPKHQSGENLVWPTTRKEVVPLVCRLVMHRQQRYWSIQLFLFCSVQFFGVQVHLLLPEAVMVEVLVKLTYHYVRSLTTISCLISEKVDLAWMALQCTPKMVHLLGVRKNIGPGCCGSDGKCTCCV